MQHHQGVNWYQEAAAGAFGGDTLGEGGLGCGEEGGGGGGAQLGSNKLNYRFDGRCGRGKEGRYAVR